MDEALRAGIQCDGAECFLQLALFEPGKELLEQHPEALDALRALVDGAALTEEARLSASSALAAVEGVAPGSAPAGDDKHIMMSCVSLAHAPLVIDCRAVRPMGRGDHPAPGCVAAGAATWSGSGCAIRTFAYPFSSVCLCRPGAHEGVGGRRVSVPMQPLLVLQAPDSSEFCTG